MKRYIKCVDSREDYERLAFSGEAWDRQEAAGDPDTPADILTALAFDPDIAVRYSIAANPSTPPETLRDLATEPDIGLIGELTYNDNLDAEAISIIYDRWHYDYSICYNIATLPNAPEDVLEKLAQHDSWSIRRCVAENSRTPARLLERLAQDSDIDVIQGVVQNSNTPQNLLIHLAETTKSYKVLVTLYRYCLDPAVLEIIDQRIQESR